MGKEEKKHRHFVENCKDFYNKSATLVGNVKKEVDIDCLKDISIPYNTNLKELDTDIFAGRIKDTFNLPISNEKFKQLYYCGKRGLNGLSISYNEETKLINEGMYLLGRDENSKPLLFSFSFTLDKDYPSHFSIKLYAVVNNRHKMLLRLDSDGFDHPVYLKNGEFVESLEDKINVPTPHIHVASHEMEVIGQNEKSYSHAYYVGDRINKEECIKDGTYLTKCMEYMVSLMNLNVSLNYESLKELQTNPDENNIPPIFNNELMLEGETVNNLHVYRNGYFDESIDFHITQLIPNYNYSTRNLTKKVEMAQINLPKSKHQLHKEYNNKEI